MGQRMMEGLTPDGAEAEEELGITEWAVCQFQTAYGRDDIGRDEIYSYVYGVMHCPVWRARYEHELQRQHPRIPLAKDFDVFRAAGEELMTLHADYETGPQNLDVNIYLSEEMVGCDSDGEPVSPIADVLLRVAKSPYWTVDGKRLTSLAWAWEFAEADSDPGLPGRVRLALNSEVSLGDFPEGTFGYQVSGRSPLEWAARYLVNETNKQTGLPSDVNSYELWADDPFELVRYLRRLVHVAVRSTETISGLPDSLDGALEVPAFKTDTTETQAQAAT